MLLRRARARAVCVDTLGALARFFSNQRCLAVSGAGGHTHRLPGALPNCADRITCGGKQTKAQRALCGKMAAMAAALRRVPPFTPLKRETTPEDAPTDKTIGGCSARGFGDRRRRVEPRRGPAGAGPKRGGPSAARREMSRSIPIARRGRRAQRDASLGRTSSAAKRRSSSRKLPNAERRASDMRRPRASTKLGLTPTSAV